MSRHPRFAELDALIAAEEGAAAPKPDATMPVPGAKMALGPILEAKVVVSDAPPCPHCHGAETRQHGPQQRCKACQRTFRLNPMSSREKAQLAANARWGKR